MKEPSNQSLGKEKGRKKSHQSKPEVLEVALLALGSITNPTIWLVSKTYTCCDQDTETLDSWTEAQEVKKTFNIIT